MRMKLFVAASALLGALSLTPGNDLNASLTVQVTDTANNSSAPATEAVTVNPLAPGVVPVGMSGVQGQPIALNLGLGVNGLIGDTNQLASVTLGSIPVGAVLSNTNGNTLTVILDLRPQSRPRENSSKSVTAGSNTLDQRALRNKVNFEFSLHHLLLRVGIEANMAYDSLPDELG